MNDEFDDNIEDYEGDDYQYESDSPNLFEHYRFEVDRGQGMLRIDKFLQMKIENASRTKIQAAAEAGFIVVNGTSARANYRVKPGDVIRVMLS